MNANELANFLETDCWYKLITRHDIATMLRQQQAEIEALKAQVLAWENAEVPVEVMAEIVEELERRGFITK